MYHLYPSGIFKDSNADSILISFDRKEQFKMNPDLDALYLQEICIYGRSFLAKKVQFLFFFETIGLAL